ncbi:hypothetical protein [Amycolatopsis suaedae]|uniref:Uncharacterized protein n=1 Tax=Amycolatopsis suaedae TaxID=2510978 RepID=A0A4Q7J1D6_9PSEU|nr:hypothetical protein [Amycolatopsis suaedae]RZQ61210.1 hypothetical protein EWH70_25385 [Amycolatopsis suaedae]
MGYAENKHVFRLKVDEELRDSFEAACLSLSMHPLAVLRSFVRWYCRVPDCPLPERPGDGPLELIEAAQAAHRSQLTLARVMAQLELLRVDLDRIDASPVQRQATRPFAKSKELPPLRRH